jgi:RNA polymerase sigma-70 factor, ECF subfamily
VVKYQKLAYNVAYRIVQSRETAADAVQDSFMKALRALPSFHGDSLKAWLLRIVINTCYDLLRRERRLPLEALTDESAYEDDAQPTHQPVDPQESPQAFAERSELHTQIELGLRILPSEQRVVLMLYDMQGYSYEEISEITQMPLGTVKSRLNRARLKLRDYLVQQGELAPLGWH